jgi:hypothetical protein
MSMRKTARWLAVVVFSTAFFAQDEKLFVVLPSSEAGT